MDGVFSFIHDFFYISIGILLKKSQRINFDTIFPEQIKILYIVIAILKFQIQPGFEPISFFNKIVFQLRNHMNYAHQEIMKQAHQRVDGLHNQLQMLHNKLQLQTSVIFYQC